jgi:hypothetical protein
MIHFCDSSQLSQSKLKFVINYLNLTNDQFAINIPQCSTGNNCIVETESESESRKKT